MRRSILLIFLLATALAAAKDKPPAKGLAPKLHQLIDRVEAAYFAGDIEDTWRVLAPAIAGLKDDAGAKLDEALAAKKLPLAREILVEARLKLLTEGRTAALPAPSLRERLLVLEALHDHVRQPLQEISSQPLLKEDTPPPANLDEFDRRFDDVHNLSGKLRMAASCARYAAELAGNMPPAVRKKLTDDEREIVAESEGDLVAQVDESERGLRELELETRLLRLRYGVEALKQRQLTKEKFTAAASTRQDARYLKYELEPPDPGPAKGKNSKASGKKAVPGPAPAPVALHRAALTAPDLVDEVAKLARQADELAGPLGEKADRFFTGLELWLRGRYGWGPDVWGLAKSSAVLQQPELLQQIYMPENLLTPNDTKEQPKPATPGRRPETLPDGTQQKKREMLKCPDRRHHYTWAWEDRRLAVIVAAQPGHVTEGSDFQFEVKDPRQKYLSGRIGPSYWISGTTGNTVYTRETEKTVSVPPQDPRLVYRIVGFIEYAQAVQNLDTFVEQASDAELAVAEEIIRSQAAFRIDTNLSRRIETAGMLSERSPNPRDDFSRQGLEWMLALARVEPGAMLAGFTSHAEPFLSLAPTIRRKSREKPGPFGSAAYAEMLLDGLRTHYWSIAREDVIADYYKTGVPENHLLTYGRRAILGRQFVRAVLEYSGAGNEGENLPPAHRTEVQTWDQTFQKLQRILLYCLTFKVGQQKTTNDEKHYANVYHGLIIDSTKSTTTEKRDQTPDAIRRLILLVDPTLAGCGCQ